MACAISTRCNGCRNISSDRKSVPAAVEAGIFTPEEVQTFRRCEDFLWRVRCFLHFLTGRAEEVLSFEVQPAMAQSLGYTSRGGMRAVERFMKHYFLIAKDVGDSDDDPLRRPRNAAAENNARLPAPSQPAQLENAA